MRFQKLEHIYIHWPFCKNKCHYCDFISFEKHDKFERDYHNALCAEIKKFAGRQTEKFSIKTIFIGGGTPSLYPLELFKELLDILRVGFNLNDLQEVTLECNPQDVTEQHLKVWSEVGINRLSIGVQVLDDQILLNLNRKQKKEDVFNLMEIAPKYFDNISVDLILGLPGTTEEIWHDTLNQVISWPIQHVSVYLLMVYEKTPIFFKIEKKETNLIPDEQLVSLYKETVEFLKKHGFEQYEISNFAKPGFCSLHNQAYWDRKPYRAFGLGASSFDGFIRFINEKNLLKYLNSCNQADNIECFSETLTRRQEFVEILMLGLRSTQGVGLQRMLYFLNEDEKREFIENLEVLKSNGLTQERGGKVSLTLKGMTLENEVILKLIQSCS